MSLTLWVLAACGLAALFPETLRTVGGAPSTRLIAPINQMILFGLGLRVGLGDFAAILRMPKALGVCLALQYAVMPLAGWGAGRAFGIDENLMAGLVLIGCAPAGVASNVMTYLAHGNVALAVLATFCTTLLSPLSTPLGMKLMAGRLVTLPFLDLAGSIFWMVAVPVVAGCLVNRYLPGVRNALDRVLPAASRIGVCVAVAILTAHSLDRLAQGGLLLACACMVHNAVGYAAGYWGARWMARLDEAACRAASFGVGMRNGGLATALALDVLQLPDASLAPAIFGIWMNASGSSLASWWARRHPTAPAKPSAAYAAVGMVQT